MSRRNEIRDQKRLLVEAMQKVADELGLRIDANSSVRFTDDSFTFKIEVLKARGDCVALSKDERAFNDHAPLMGLDGWKLGDTFTLNHEDFVLAGLRPRSPKYPILAKRRSNGQMIKVSLQAFRGLTPPKGKQALGNLGSKTGFTATKSPKTEAAPRGGANGACAVIRRLTVDGLSFDEIKNELADRGLKAADATIRTQMRRAAAAL